MLASGPWRVNTELRRRREIGPDDALQPPRLSDLELVVNGRVLAATSSPATTEMNLHETIEIGSGAWIAARSRSASQIESAFTTSMAAHTSAVYVEVADRPLVVPPGAAEAVEQVIAGARTWVAELAAVEDPGERARMLRFFDASLETFRSRRQ
jgi:hypothetical protein